MKINNHENLKKITYNIRNVDIPSRFFFAPINTGLSEKGILSKEYLEFYIERSHTSIGINYIGNVAIGSKYVTNPNTAYFTQEVLQWKKLTRTIKENGSIPGIQIACRHSKYVPLRKMINNNKEEYIRRTKKDILDLSKQEIEEILQKFVENAIKANDLGFDVIQIHAAHGYFLSQFLSTSLNIRKDEYNANDILFIESIIKKIRHLRPNLIIDLRISFIEGIKDEKEEKIEKEKLIKKLVTLDIDIISFSNGIYDINKQLIYPIQKWGHACFIENIVEYANKYPEILWNYSGNIWDFNLINFDDIPKNLSFSLGRSLIADPLFIEKSLNNKSHSINKCVYKNKCHYYSLNSTHIGCPIYNQNILNKEGQILS
ncbi:hypothetical protein ACA785_000975 [Staphylococcus pseudintermedius]|uniref:oxidoreductase n=1 Tax=Staphylococcaceae TaxID=90964 RepID=UPI000807606D|nr:MULTISPECIES: hypothetical protein [Staphylococcaceae]EGQ3470362.1 hypothetical protein [Staphylococcus pseudintermedius]EGQ3501799.1 hypothetical protein [Staphylococcus pseudintermedius]EGQ3970471.1 hypothetical protein [Staphylococcus pseudintermedius]EGQ3993433.1 hypothetical protein [Staphylococcus pseudintermedius]EGQ4422280.1 hypothetical protein [Staphylococcus pseudintermedius]